MSAGCKVVRRRYPMRATLPCCCATTASGAASKPTVTTPMNVRRSNESRRQRMAIRQYYRCQGKPVYDRYWPTCWLFGNVPVGFRFGRTREDALRCWSELFLKRRDDYFQMVVQSGLRLEYLIPKKDHGFLGSPMKVKNRIRLRLPEKFDQLQPARLQLIFPAGR